MEEKTGAVIAEFYPSWNEMDSTEHKIGKLHIKEQAKALMDHIVVTALIVQERSEEGREAVTPSSTFTANRIEKKTKGTFNRKESVERVTSL